MRRARRTFAWTAAILLIALGVFLVPTIWFRPWSLDHFYARTFVAFAARHPMLMTNLGLLDGTPLDFYSDKLDDFSPAAEDKEVRFLEKQLAILHSYDRTKLRRD